MNKFTFILLYYMSSFAGFAQTKNVDISNMHVDCVYRDTPRKPLNPPYFYYSTTVIANSVTRTNITVQEVENAMFIEGQKKRRLQRLNLRPLPSN